MRGFLGAREYHILKGVSGIKINWQGWAIRWGYIRGPFRIPGSQAPLVPNPGYLEDIRDIRNQDQGWGYQVLSLISLTVDSNKLRDSQTQR